MRCPAGHCQHRADARRWHSQPCMHADVRCIDDVIPFFEVPTTMARISWILFQIEMTNVRTITYDRACIYFCWRPFNQPECRGNQLMCSSLVSLFCVSFSFIFFNFFFINLALLYPDNPLLLVYLLQDSFYYCVSRIIFCVRLRNWQPARCNVHTFLKYVATLFCCLPKGLSCRRRVVVR